MRIAAYYHLPFGGAQRALYTHLKGLQERGHEIATFGPPRSPGDLIEGLGIPHFASTSPVVLYERTGYWERIHDQYRREAILQNSITESTLKSATDIRQWGADVVLANTSLHVQVPLIGGYLTQPGDPPSILYLQEANRSIYEAWDGQSWIQRPKEWFGTGLATRAKRHLRDRSLFNNLRKRARREIEGIRGYKVILANSFYSRESMLRSYGPRHIEVCYLGIDFSTFPLLNLEREPFILSVGTFEITKNPELALRAVASLPAPRPPLVWVASYASTAVERNMRILAEELGVDLDLRMNVSDVELVDLMNRASVMLFVPRLEPFGYAPLEANACGLPVVTIAEGGCRETIVPGINGLVAEPSPIAVGQALQQVMSDGFWDDEARLKARNQVMERWNYQAAAERLEQKLLSAVAQKDLN